MSLEVDKIYFFKDRGFYYRVLEVREKCIKVEMPTIHKNKLMWPGRGTLPISMLKDFEAATIVTEDEVLKKLGG